MRKKAKSIIKSCFVGCCKGIWWTIKHIAIALWLAIKYISITLWWCTKKLFIGLKRFTIWSYKKIKQSIENRRQKTVGVMNTNKNGNEFNSELSVNIDIDPEQFSENVDKAFSDFQKNMSNEEAQLHFIKILLLSNELAKEIREFSNASINNDDYKSYIDYSAWQNAVGKLMTEKNRTVY